MLDIAGGKGAVTMELAATHGVRCTLVDPLLRRGRFLVSLDSVNH